MGVGSYCNGQVGRNELDDLSSGRVVALDGKGIRHTSRRERRGNCVGGFTRKLNPLLATPDGVSYSWRCLLFAWLELVGWKNSRL